MFKMIDLDADERTEQEKLLARENYSLKRQLSRQRRRYRRSLTYSKILLQTTLAMVMILAIGVAALTGLLFHSLNESERAYTKSTTGQRVFASDYTILLTAEECAKITQSIALQYGRELGVVPNCHQTNHWSNGSLTLLEFYGDKERQMTLIVTCDGAGEINVNCAFFECGVEVASWRDRMKIKADKVGELLRDADWFLEEIQFEPDENDAIDV